MKNFTYFFLVFNKSNPIAKARQNEIIATLDPVATNKETILGIGKSNKNLKLPDFKGFSIIKKSKNIMDIHIRMPITFSLSPNIATLPSEYSVPMPK